MRDDGPGFAPEVLAKLGEPYVTSRPGGEGSRTGHIGMGLGFFIAKTLLERTGAVVTFPATARPRRRRGRRPLAARRHRGAAVSDELREWRLAERLQRSDRMPQRRASAERAVGGRRMTDLSDDVAALPDKTLLVLDDDAPLRTRLGRALEQRGFEPTLVGSVAEALAAVKAHAPAFAVLDMRLEDGTGLKVVEAVRDAAARRQDHHADRLRQHRHRRGGGEGRRGRLSVQARRRRRRGPRPAGPRRRRRPPPPENPMSADRVRWEHIQRVYELCDHNVSETARRLNMHRRTLQRILAKRAPR